MSEPGTDGRIDDPHDSDHSDRAHPSPLRRLLGLLQAERSDIGKVVLFAVGVGVFSLATPIVAMAVVNTVALATLVQQLIVLCAALFVALGLAGVLQFLQTVVVEYIQRRLFVRVAAVLGYRLPRIDVREYDQQHGPELVNRFFDVLTVQKASATLLLDGVTLALQVLIGLTLLGFYHRILLGFDLVLLASLAVLFFVLGWGATRTAIRESVAKYAVAGWMEEIARHPVAFKTAGGPRFALDRTDELTRDYLIARALHFRVLMRQFGFALVLQACANVALLGLGGYLVIRGELSLGELVAAEIVVTLVVATFTRLYKQLEAYYDLLAAVDKLGHLVDLPLERTGAELLPARTTAAEVRLKNVSFSYAGGQRLALENVNLHLAPGERVALMGPNGAGKSTLTDILFGLRRPTHGAVTLDGIDCRSLQLESIRERVALVDRIEVFQGTVLANVRMGRADISLESVHDILRKVHVLRTVLDLPDGLETELSTGGSPMSLGQANRLMLARAIVGRPRLLILDETLDTMDAELRSAVMPVVLDRTAPWTLLVITHSVDVAKKCDRIVRLERAVTTLG